MSDPSPLCPTCHSKVDPAGPNGSRIKDAISPGIPAWSDDPALTPEGFNGPEYKNSEFLRTNWIKEIQDVRKQQEADAGVSPPTEFTPIEKDVSFLFATHFVELRISTERILDAVGSTLEDYFKLDTDGVVQPHGPNDVADKKEWSEISRGTAYNNQERNLSILQNDTKQFLVNATTPKDTPTVLKDTTFIKAILFEDLRHPIQTKSWKEGFSQAPVNNSFSMSFDNKSANLNITIARAFEGTTTQFIGDMANPNVDINDNPYFVKQIMSYEVPPISPTVQIAGPLNYAGTLTGGASGPPPISGPKPATPISYKLTGQIPGVQMLYVGANEYRTWLWAGYNIWQVVSPPKLNCIIETVFCHRVRHTYYYGVSHDHIIVLSRSRATAASFSGNMLTQHYSEGANWNKQPWKYWYITTWNYGQAYNQATALLSSPGFLPTPNPSAPMNFTDTTVYDEYGHMVPHYDNRFYPNEQVLWEYEWDEYEYGSDLEDAPLIYYIYGDNDLLINSDVSNFNDTGEPVVIGSALVRPWDFVPNHPEITPAELPYSPIAVQLTNSTAIRITLSEKSYHAGGITPEVNPVSNANLAMDLYIESPKVPEIIGPPFIPEQPEIKDKWSFNINGPGIIVDGKKVYTIYLTEQQFETGISRFIGKRCYFSIGLTPQITTRLSGAWHDPKWDQAVPSSAIPGAFWGTTTFVNPRNATGTITIDSVEIKKILKTTGLIVMAGTGLNAEYSAGTIQTGGSPISVSAGSVTVTDGPTTFDERTNYIEVSPASVVSSNITGFTTGWHPLAIVVAQNITIISITDKRE